MDYVLAEMRKLKVPMTQRNYIEIASLGEKTSINELGPEEIADLPEDFDSWPVEQMRVN